MAWRMRIRQVSGTGDAGGCCRGSDPRRGNAALCAKVVPLASPNTSPSRAPVARKTLDVKYGSVTMAEVFGPGGLLERCMPANFEVRRSQQEMAEMVEEAFRTKHHVIVEAGTGTGKTLAYLIPAIRSGRRVVVSTATKSLQEQLFNKDIP